MLRVQILGELAVELDGEPVALPKSSRACLVLGWLALHPGTHPRSRLASLLWPEVLDASARASLRSAVWALRSALGPAAGAYVVTDRDSIELTGPDLLVDVREFVRLTSKGLAVDAVGLCSGELLYRYDDDWVCAAREEHETVLADTLRTLVADADGSEFLDEALGWARRRVALQPLNEDATRALMRALAVRGGTSAALEAYQRLRQRLRDELGVVPTAETRQAAARLQATSAPPPDPTAGFSPAPVSRMVGRDAELAVLTRAWRYASAGHGQVVILTGEGGIGKSRLAEEVARVAQSVGGVVAVGVADPNAAGRPLAPWAELLDELVDHVGPVPAAMTARLGQFGLGHDASPDRVRDPRLDRLRFFEAVSDLVGWASDERPLLLVLEDVHLADPSTVAAAAHVARRIVRRPVMLVLTRRQLPPRPDVDALVGTLRARSSVGVALDVHPLPAPAVRDLARSVADLTQDELDEVAAIAEGSPLIAVEASRAFRRGDRASGLREATRSAMARLGGPAKRFVELLAVAGRDLDRAEVGSLSALPDPLRAATEALGADLLRMTGGAVGFRHGLLREAVYDDLPEPLRASLHETYAQCVRARATRSRNAHAAEVAHHLRLAGRDDLALGQLARAAADARALAALAEATAYLQEALDIEPHDPDLLIELAEIHAWRSQATESDDAFNRALAAIDADDLGALASAWLRRGRWVRGALCVPRESRRSYLVALDVLDREEIPDPLAKAEAMAGLAWAEAVAGDAAGVETLLDQVAEILGTTAPDDILRHDIGNARAFALIRAGRFTESFGPLDDAAAAAVRAGRPDMAYGVLANAAAAAACSGDFTQALDFADRCAAIVTPSGLLQPALLIHTARAALLRRMDHLAAAADAARTAAGLAERIDDPALTGLVHHEEGQLALALGRPSEAAEALQSALDLGAPVSRPLARLLRAEALARAGRPDQAQHELRLVALEPVSHADFPDTLVARMNFVEALIARGNDDLDLAERRLHQAADGWQKRIAVSAAGDTYTNLLTDLGRPPVTMLVEPDRELARVRAELEVMHTC